MKTDRAKSPTKFYTIPQIAECVDASTRTVRRWIEKGLLVAYRINGLVRISEADFQAFLATHRDHLTASFPVTKSHKMSIVYWSSGTLYKNIRPYIL